MDLPFFGASKMSLALDFAAFAYTAVKRSPAPLAPPAQRRRLGTSVAASSTDLADGNAEAPTGPYIASDGRWRERYASVSLAAFLAKVQCTAHEERPLRCLLVGHNPYARAPPARGRTLAPRRQSARGRATAPRPAASNHDLCFTGRRTPGPVAWATATPRIASGACCARAASCPRRGGM